MSGEVKAIMWELISLKDTMDIWSYTTVACSLNKQNEKNILTYSNVGRRIKELSLSLTNHRKYHLHQFNAFVE